MPFDQATYPETTTDPFTVTAFRNWLEEQVRLGRGEEEYCFTNVGHCLIAQYLKSLGYPRAHTGAYTYNREDGTGRRGLPAHWNDVANGWGGPRTFSAALDRANAYLEGE